MKKLIVSLLIVILSCSLVACVIPQEEQPYYGVYTGASASNKVTINVDNFILDESSYAYVVDKEQITVNSKSASGEKIADYYAFDNFNILSKGDIVGYNINTLRARSGRVNATIALSDNNVIIYSCVLSDNGRYSYTNVNGALSNSGNYTFKNGLIVLDGVLILSGELSKSYLYIDNNSTIHNEVLVKNISNYVVSSPVVERCEVTYHGGDNGTILGNSSQTIIGGDNAEQVTAIANEGYTFVAWSDGTESATRRDYRIIEHMSVTAIYEQLQYDIRYIAEENGVISGEERQSVLSNGSGSEVTAVARNGYRFIEWGDGVKTAARRDNNIMADMTVKAIFEKIPDIYYSVSYEAAENGTISGESRQSVIARGNGSVVKAVANDGYRFIAWSDGNNSPTRAEYNLKADISVKATFERIVYTVRYTVAKNGTISGETVQTISSGENASAVTAIPSEGYKFISWADGVTTATRQDNNILSNMAVRAIFAQITYTLTYTVGENGTLSGSDIQSVVMGGNGSQVTAVANSGYEFVEWSDGVKSATRRDSNVLADTSVVAVFRAIVVTYKLTYTVGENGTLLGSDIQAVVMGGNGSQVTAVANSGYEFVEWSDGVKTATRQDINVLSDIRVTAIFNKIHYNVTYAAGENGTIVGEVVQSVVKGGNSSDVTAVANSGYEFVEWSDGVNTVTRRENNVLANKSVTATFVAVLPENTTEFAGGSGSLGNPYKITDCRCRTI